MTLPDLAAGAELAACFAATAATASRVARCLPDGAGGAERTVAGLVAGLAQLVIVGEALGAAGQLRLVPAIAAAWVATGAVLLATRGRATPLRLPGLPRTTPGRVSLALLVATAALAAALALSGPSHEPDTVQYHVPNAAHWLQSGSTWSLPFAEPADHTAGDPGNGELVGLWLMLPTHDDRLVTLAPLLFAALCIAGVAAVARRLGGGGARGTLAGLAAVVTPAVWVTQERSLDTDLLAAGGVIGGAALLLDRREEGRALRTALAGAALGLAAGSKYAALAPAVATAVVLLARRGTTLAHLATAGLGAALTGAFWYVRNASITGDPVWPQSISALGHTLAAGSAVPLAATESLLANLLAGRVAEIRVWLVIAVFLLGPVLLLAGAGVALAVRRRDGRREPPAPAGGDAHRVAVAAALCFGAYWATPLTGGGAVLDTKEIGQDLRFALPAVLLGVSIAVARLRPRTLDLAVGAALLWSVALAGEASQYRDDLALTPAVVAGALVLCAGAAAVALLVDREAARRTRAPGSGASPAATPRSARAALVAAAAAVAATSSGVAAVAAAPASQDPGLGLPSGATVAVIDVHDVRALLAPGYSIVAAGVGHGPQGALTPDATPAAFDASLSSLHASVLAVGRVLHTARPAGWSPSPTSWRWVGVVGDADVYAAISPRPG